MKALFLLFTLILGGLLSANGTEASPSPFSSDASPVVDPALVSARFHQVLQQSLYRENTEPDPHAEVRDWLSRWFNSIGQDFDHFGYSEEMPRFASLVMTTLGVLTGIALLYILARLIRRSGRWDRTRAFGDNGFPTGPQMDSSAMDLNQALANRDWRRAWRATWRNFLFLLEQGKLVASDRSRTNREYFAQVRDLPLPTASRFDQMVSDYDRVIYGERAIEENDWRSFQQLVEETAFSLNLREKPAPVAKEP